MGWRASQRYLDLPGPRHEVGFYDQAREAVLLERGERMFIPCRGGPSDSRLEAFPPRLEIDERGGIYSLVDIGLRADWYYQFVPNPEL